MRGWEDPPPVPDTKTALAVRLQLAECAESGNSACPGESEAGPAVFRVVAVALAASPALRLTLYGVGLVQLTEAGDVAFPPAAE